MKSVTILFLLLQPQFLFATTDVGKTPEQKYIEQTEIVFDLQKWEDGFIYPGAWRAAVGKVHSLRVDGKWVNCLLLEIRIEYTAAKFDKEDRWLEYHLVTYEYKVLGRIR